MQHVTMADKSLLVGEEAVALLLDYAALIAKTASGDSVHVSAYGVDGEEVVASLVLNSGTVLVAETSRSTLPEPDNTALEEYLRARLESFSLTAMQPVGLELNSDQADAEKAD